MNLKALIIKYLLPVLLLLTAFNVSAQNKSRAQIDSLLRKLPAAKEDTNKVNLLIALGRAYTMLKKPDSAARYMQPALTLTEKLEWQGGYDQLYIYYQDLRAFDKIITYSKRAAELGLKTGNYHRIYLAGESILFASRGLNKIPEGLGYVKSIAGRMDKKHHPKELANMYAQIADFTQEIYNYSEAVDYDNKALAMEEADHRQYLDMGHILGIAYLHIKLHDNKMARALLQKGETTYKAAHHLNSLVPFYFAFAFSYNDDHNYKAAVTYYKKCADIEEKYYHKAFAETQAAIGWNYFLLRDYENAYAYSARAVLLAKGDSAELAGPLSTLGSIYREAPASLIKKAGIKPGTQYNLSVKLLSWAINYSKRKSHFEDVNDNTKELSLTYEKMHRYADAFKTYKEYTTSRESLDSLQNSKAALLKEAQFNYLHKEDSLNYRQAITNTLLKQKKQQSYFFIGGIGVLLLLSMFIWRSYNNQRKSNKLLANANHQLGKQREEITSQRDQLANTITDLKAAQQQLIQSEKMASLGELTAGIAHEIQNPLNFVNNFSEVSKEMLEELKEGLEKGDTEEAKAIAADVIGNLEKITHHGKRADSIVKGMLEHSRASTGQKELTDLNKLADEYLRMAYHGLRAKDKAFNAELVPNFDEDLPQINIIPQDMGRVLLNLFNNAFYAVQKKQETAGEHYKPAVEVSTLVKNDTVEISVKDNGIGIPNAIKRKIMQPFFTTKPTGEGTGLGLSLSYDILVKVHGGNINVNSVEGVGSEFIIQLPIIVQ